jgi:hypothetical protein
MVVREAPIEFDWADGDLEDPADESFDDEEEDEDDDSDFD